MKYATHTIWILPAFWVCTGFHTDPILSRNRAAKSFMLDAVPDDEIVEMKDQLKAQQRQIDTLISLLQQQQQKPSPAAPLKATTIQKAMLFIDGTWLYYSLHERSPNDCPFIQNYGMGWQNRYDMNWTALPGVICDAVQDAEHYMNRKVEIVRASVYTSYKSDTNKRSYRYKLFEDLRAANYDVNMMETVGTSEKCVDIQLAVDMLYYATDGGGAFDIAFLLTGDKDFMPAMIRTRQRGKAVGLVSMVQGCNRALVETDGLKDFDVFWLENYLDQLVVPKKVTSEHEEIVSTFTLNKVVFDFVQLSGFPYVSSRDLGRFLKLFRISGVSLLDVIKEYYGGLWFFLQSSGQFTLKKPRKMDDRSFTISLTPDANQKLMEEAKRTNFTSAERLFFEKYKYENQFLKNQERAYPNTMYQMGLSDSVDTQFYDDASASQTDVPSAVSDKIPEYLSRDYSECTVNELKEVCRKHGLPVSGVKAALIERVNSFVKNEERKHIEKIRARTQTAPTVSVDPKIASHLIDLVKEYLHATGGEASSRDVGRYLAANKDSFGSRSALSQLKQEYGSLGTFISAHSEIFLTKDAGGKEFIVGMHNQEHQ